MASGYIGEHNVSTYILQRLYWSTSAVGSSGHNVYVENQLRRTNSYSGTTFGYPSGSYITINGNRQDWSWSSQDYPSIPGYNTDWIVFCSRTHYVAHTSAVTIYIAGGNYDMGSYLSGDCGGNISLSALYTAPATPSAENLESDGTPHKAYSKVTSNGWGTNSSRKQFEIICNSSIKASNSTDSPASMYWTLPNGSTNTSACAINTWYGRAVNNHSLWTDSGARYVATPSAPTLTITAGSGTTPQTAISGVVSYKGGTQNSATCNNGTMKRWQFGQLLSSESGTPSAFQNDIESSNTTESYTWSRDNFALGNSYKFYVRAVNNYGGASSSTSNIIYCPTGVNGSVTGRTTDTMTFKGTYNYAGTINSSTAGTISCYEIKWSTNKTTVDNGGGTSTGLQTSDTFTITGLSNDQTIYYRVYAWNVYGLSNVSSTHSATTMPRYTPSLSNISTSPLSPGGDVTFTIDRTGGLSENELAVTSVEIARRPSSSSTWTTLKTIDGLELYAGGSYTIQNAWTDAATNEGNYTYRIHLSNGVDVSDTTFVLAAPSSVTISAGLVGDEPIQISARGNAISETQLYKWDLISTSTGQSKTVNTSSTTPTITTSNHLNYDTSYAIKMRAYNSYGLWRDSAATVVKTKPRFQFYAVSGNTSKKADALFSHNNSAKRISDVYYIVKNSLGSMSVGDDLYNKRLKFITQTLRYRPENVASMMLSDGSKIAYAYDSTNDLYKFGIWRGNTLETVFHDGWNWRTTEYEFTESTVITSISNSSGNLNASAAFSTTTCEDIPLWERETMGGLGRIFYYTDDTNTTTGQVDISSQSQLNALAAGTTEDGWSATIGDVVITSDNIKSIVLTNRATSLPQLFLANSTWLQSVVMTNANTTSIGDYTCYNCGNLLTASLPSSLTAIPSYVFYNCVNLNTLMNIPSNVKTIGSYFMGFCIRQNQAVNLPEGLTTIGDYFMSGCGIFDQPLTIPSTVTSIGNYFLSANFLFDRDITLPSGLTHLGNGFMYNCLNMTKTVNVGALTATIATVGNNTLSTLHDTAACYVTGITIRGTNQSDWLARFENRDTSPYRYLKGYEEPVIVTRDWGSGTILNNTTILRNIGNFDEPPFADFHTLIDTDNYISLLDTSSGNTYRTLYENINNYDSLNQIARSSEFSVGSFYSVNANGYAYYLDLGASQITYEIVKNPSLGIVWTGRGSADVQTGISTFWQGQYIMADGNYISIVQDGVSAATITITSNDLKNIEDISEYKIATWTYWENSYIIYLSDIDESTYDSSTGTATFPAGATVGPIMLIHEKQNKK